MSKLLNNCCLDEHNQILELTADYIYTRMRAIKLIHFGLIQNTLNFSFVIAVFKTTLTVSVSLSELGNSSASGIS